MAAERETPFIDQKELSEKVTECGLDKDDMIEVLTSYADLEQDFLLAKKEREARFLSLSEASCRYSGHSHQLTRIKWNYRTIFLLVFLIIVLLVIMFNIYIHLIFP